MKNGNRDIMRYKRMSKTKRRKVNKTIILIVVGSIIFMAMVGTVVRMLWYKRKCDIIYNEVNASVVECDEIVYGEYGGQKVMLSRPNLNYVLKSVTDRLVVLSSADKMPSGDPVSLYFGEVLLMEIYKGEGYDVFVKHVIDNKTKYYIIDGTCNFKNLKKMVSLDEWSYPNFLVEE